MREPTVVSVPIAVLVDEHPTSTVTDSTRTQLIINFTILSINIFPLCSAYTDFNLMASFLLEHLATKKSIKLFDGNHYAWRNHVGSLVSGPPLRNILPHHITSRIPIRHRHGVLFSLNTR